MSVFRSRFVIRPMRSASEVRVSCERSAGMKVNYLQVGKPQFRPARYPGGIKSCRDVRVSSPRIETVREENFLAE